jgi:electron transfer flavoprotein alpha subunit
MWVFCESKDGKFLPVSLEMLGEARRLMDKYNADYRREEKVVALVLGQNAEALAAQAARSGADTVYWADTADLNHFRIEPYTKAVSDLALDKARNGYDKPRYFLYPATHNGRDLSATVCAVLEAGCASDCNKLYIEDVPMKHPLKTGGVEKTIEAVLHMKRPDFSGFEWSTILCLDDIYNDWKPESCSVIPGSFKPFERATHGKVVRTEPKLDAKALRVKVPARRKLGGGVDLGKYDIIVALGRGIGRDPSKGIKLGIDLARALGGEVGISRGVVTAKYKVEPGLVPYIAEERQIGETGQMVKPKLYIALGISGAIQHKKGMDQSNVIVAVNTDENVPIKEFSDVFVHGDLYEVVPRLIEELRAQGVVRTPMPPAGGR